MKFMSLSLRNTLGASVGTALEFYDFTLYGVFAVTFSAIFFPEKEMATSFSLVIYALGSFLRPLGGLVFGYLSDITGRKKALLVSVFIMAIATFGMGCLPVYADFGIGAILLLILLRAMQGFSAGGEFNNTTIYALESGKQRPGLYSGIVVASATFGTLIAMALSALILKIHHPDAWRIPFLLGGLIGFLGYYARNFLHESPAFEQGESQIWQNVIIIFQQYKSPLIKTIFLGGFASALGLTIFNYINIYLNNIIGFHASESAFLSIVGIAGFILLTPLFGFLADIVTPRKILCASAIMTCCSAYFIYHLLSSGYILNIIVGQLFLTILSSSFSGSIHLYLIQLFPSKLRCLAVSFGFTLGIAIFGGTTPLISNLLIKYTGNILSPSFYLILMATCVITILYSKRMSFRLGAHPSASFV